MHENGDEMPQAFADEDITNAIMGQIDGLISDSAVQHLWNEYVSNLKCGMEN